MFSHDARLRVRYAETDQMGVVYYSNYLVWMEVGRVEFCSAAGFRYREMESEDGILLAVAEAHCRYLSPARYDDEVIVRTSVGQVAARMVRFDYRMCEAVSGRALAEGYTKHLFCDRDFRPARLPARYMELLRNSG
jgi:acyl-CoA thioester hydrolase